jgi:hypothetical protein
MFLMTSLNSDPTVAGRSAAAAVPADQVRDHAADRFERGMTARAQQSAVSQRSRLIIYAVIAVGVIVWMVFTL